MASSSEPSATPTKKPLCIICIGMAGSGKTTFLQRINSHLHSIKKPPYIINLDPAVIKLPFQPNIDIRDTIDYKEVMKQYNLGPNGGILTALNLFTTKFDQVLSYVEKRVEQTEYVLVDTPGQIEIFTWSASGSIITDALASALPTCVAYIIDTPRTSTPSTFMSNMLYSCSILYKTRLPFLLVFNKTDVQPHEFAIEWMKDFETFQLAQASKRDSEQHTDESGNYMSSLINSMSLVLDEFYQNLRTVGCSAMTGFGIEDFFIQVEGSRQEYETDYFPELKRRQEERAKQNQDRKAADLSNIMTNMKVSSDSKPSTTSKLKDPTDLTSEEIELEQSEFAQEQGEELDKNDVPPRESLSSSLLGTKVSIASKMFGVEEDSMGGRWPAPR